MDVSVEIHCSLCGSANYSLPEDQGDEASLQCNDCGRPLGSVADLKVELLGQARARSAEVMRREAGRLSQDHDHVRLDQPDT
jgi:hypothetical protein